MSGEASPASAALLARIKREIAGAEHDLSELVHQHEEAFQAHKIAIETLRIFRVARERLVRALETPAGRPSEAVSPLIDDALLAAERAQEEASAAEREATNRLHRAQKRLAAAQRARRQFRLMGWPEPAFVPASEEETSR